MGRADKRGSQSSTASHGRVNSKASDLSNISPKTPATAHKRGSGSGSFKSNSSAGKVSPRNALKKAAEKLATTGNPDAVQLPGLPFKSFRNGTLMTHNGEPTVIPGMEPLPITPKVSKLSAATPHFVPSTPSPKPLTINGQDSRHYGIPSPPTPGYEKVQNLLQHLRASPNHGYGGNATDTVGGYYDGRNCGYTGKYAGINQDRGNYTQQNYGQGQYASTIGRYPTPPGPVGDGMNRNYTPSPGPSSVLSYDSVPKGPRSLQGNYAVQPPRQVMHIAQRPNREFIARKDRSKKDILVTADGITRNHVRVVERQLPNGLPYQSQHCDFDAPKYDFVKEFKNMSAKQKEDFLGRNFIDVEVQIEAEEEENKSASGSPGSSVKSVEETKTKKKRTHAGRTRNKAKMSGDEVAVQKQPVTPTPTVMVKHEANSLDILKSLGPEIVARTQRMTVTLVFPQSSNPTDLISTTTAGPVASFTITPATGPSLASPSFLLLKKLVDYIHTFKSLTHLSIILKIPASQRMPFTMPQLHHVLPFYDLGFTDWDIKYLPENLSVPAKVQGWAVGQLDRERNKIIAERLRKVEEAVFVRGSIMPGMTMSDEGLDAAAKDFNSAAAVPAAPRAPRMARIPSR